MVAEIGKAGTGDQANIAGADHCDTHSILRKLGPPCAIAFGLPSLQGRGPGVGEPRSGSVRSPPAVYSLPGSEGKVKHLDFATKVAIGGRFPWLPNSPPRRASAWCRSAVPRRWSIPNGS